MRHVNGRLERRSEGKGVLERLIKECDVLVENFAPGAMDRMGLTWERIHELNPRMIYASLSAYGETGPDAGREGFDAVTWWARSGLMDLVRAQGAAPGGSTQGGESADPHGSVDPPAGTCGTKNRPP